MSIVITKSATAVVEKVNKETRTSTITFAYTNKEDNDGDIFEKGAYKSRNKTVLHAQWNHSTDSPVAFGKIYEVGDKVKQDLTFFDTAKGNEYMEIYGTEGVEVEFSYRYVPKEYSIIDNDSFWWRTYKYKEVEVFETSAVYLPATNDTGIDGKKAAREAMFKALNPDDNDNTKATDDTESVDNTDTGTKDLDDEPETSKQAATPESKEDNSSALEIEFMFLKAKAASHIRTKEVH